MCLLKPATLSNIDIYIKTARAKFLTPKFVKQNVSTTALRSVLFCQMSHLSSEWYSIRFPTFYQFYDSSKVCVIHLRTVKLVVFDIVFQSKNLMRFGNTNKSLIKRKQKQGKYRASISPNSWLQPG